MTYLNLELLKDALQDLTQKPPPADPAELICQVFDDSGLGDLIKSGEGTSRLGSHVVALAERLSAEWDEVSRKQTLYTDSDEMRSIRDTAAQFVERLNAQGTT